MKKFILLIIIPMLFIYAGCSSEPDYSYEDNVAYEANEMIETTEDEGFGNDDLKYGGVQTDRKIIQSAFIEMETLTFDDSIEVVKNMTYEYKGYFEGMQIDGKRMDLADNEQYRTAVFRIRIPKNKFEYFLNSFEKLGNIINNELSSVDVTDRYIDTESHVKTLIIQEERLLEILKSAVNIEDIIKLEERLSQVRYEIESFSGTIRKWDNQVEFTTVDLRIMEVQKVSHPKPKSTALKAVDSFLDSTEAVIEILKGLIILTFGLIPFLIVILPVILVVRYFSKKNKIKLSFKIGKTSFGNKNKKGTKNIEKLNKMERGILKKIQKEDKEDKKED